jgi:hypothetical protein
VVHPTKGAVQATHRLAPQQQASRVHQLLLLLLLLLLCLGLLSCAVVSPAQAWWWQGVKQVRRKGVFIGR